MILLLIILVCLSGSRAYAEDTPITDELLIYTPKEMLSFDIKEYLKQNSPDLVKYSEVISHWSGYSSISPKVIITLIEQQTKLISKKKLSEVEIIKPLGSLSDQVGFSAQVKDVALQLSKSYYKKQQQLKGSHKKKENQNILQDFLKSKADDNFHTGRNNEFEKTYHHLFPSLPAQKKIEHGANKGLVNIYGALPPVGFLQLPYPIGESWYFGGSHTFTGSGSYPQSSLDFFESMVGWGTDTSNIMVVASNKGIAVKHSSCFVEVIGTDGWSTSYYHLDNVQVTTNQTVAQNSRLANYANNKAQALCNGGHSTGPHVHFSLKQNGSYAHLNGVNLSGYLVHTGRYSYDTDCNYFWISKNNTKHCAWSNLYNPGVITTTPAKATLISPIGATTDTTPVYSWSAVENSSWYRLWVNDSSGNKIKKWYTASQAGCAAGAGTCSVTPVTTLSSGSHTWWIRTNNSSGNGPWSSGKVFSVTTGGVPSKATLLSPSGTVTDTTPTYTWNAVENSSWYRLWVNDSSGNKIKKWYTASQAGCAGGTGTCSVSPVATLASGSSKWWVQTWNTAGYGQWSSVKNFVVVHTPPPPPPPKQPFFGSGLIL